jgi:TP901 family phage tail tape measure protein
MGADDIKVNVIAQIQAVGTGALQNINQLFAGAQKQAITASASIDDFFSKFGEGTKTKSLNKFNTALNNSFKEIKRAFNRLPDMDGFVKKFGLSVIEEQFKDTSIAAKKHSEYIKQVAAAYNEAEVASKKTITLMTSGGGKGAFSPGYGMYAPQKTKMPVTSFKGVIPEQIIPKGTSKIASEIAFSLSKIQLGMKHATQNAALFSDTIKGAGKASKDLDKILGSEKMRQALKKEINEINKEKQEIDNLASAEIKLNQIRKEYAKQEKTETEAAILQKERQKNIALAGARKYTEALKQQTKAHEAAKKAFNDAAKKASTAFPDAISKFTQYTFKANALSSVLTQRTSPAFIGFGIAVSEYWKEQSKANAMALGFSAALMGFVILRDIAKMIIRLTVELVKFSAAVLKAGADWAIAFGKEAIDASLKFEEMQAKTEAAAIGAGISIKGLKEEVLALAQEFGFAAEEVQKLQWKAISSGAAEADKRIAVMREGLKLARVGFSDAADTANLLTTIMAAFGVEGKDLEQAASEVFYVVSQGNTSVQELATSFGKMAKIGGTLGFQWKELGTAAAILAQQDTDAVNSLTELTNIMNSLLKMSPEVKYELERLGLETTSTAIANTGLYKWMKQLNEVLDSSPEKIREVFGDIRALRGALPLMTKSQEAWHDSLIGIEDALPRYQSALQRLDNSNAIYLEKLKNQYEILKIRIGDSFESSIGPLTRFLHENLIAITNWFREYKEIFEAVIQGVFAPFLAAAQKVMNKVKAVFTTIKISELIKFDTETIGAKIREVVSVVLKGFAPLATGLLPILLSGFIDFTVVLAQLFAETFTTGFKIFLAWLDTKGIAALTAIFITIGKGFAHALISAFAAVEKWKIDIKEGLGILSEEEAKQKRRAVDYGLEGVQKDIERYYNVGTKIFEQISESASSAFRTKLNEITSDYIKDIGRTLKEAPDKFKDELKDLKEQFPELAKTISELLGEKEKEAEAAKAHKKAIETLSSALEEASKAVRKFGEESGKLLFSPEGIPQEDKGGERSEDKDGKRSGRSTSDREGKRTDRDEKSEENRKRRAAAIQEADRKLKEAQDKWNAAVAESEKQKSDVAQEYTAKINEANAQWEKAVEEDKEQRKRFDNPEFVKEREEALQKSIAAEDEAQKWTTENDPEWTKKLDELQAQWEKARAEGDKPHIDRKPDWVNDLKEAAAQYNEAVAESYRRRAERDPEGSKRFDEAKARYRKLAEESDVQAQDKRLKEVQTQWKKTLREIKSQKYDKEIDIAVQLNKADVLYQRALAEDKKFRSGNIPGGNQPEPRDSDAPSRREPEPRDSDAPSRREPEPRDSDAPSRREPEPRKPDEGRRPIIDSDAANKFAIEFDKLMTEFEKFSYSYEFDELVNTLQKTIKDAFTAEDFAKILNQMNEIIAKAKQELKPALPKGDIPIPSGESPSSLPDSSMGSEIFALIERSMQSTKEFVEGEVKRFELSQKTLEETEKSRSALEDLNKNSETAASRILNDPAIRGLIATLSTIPAGLENRIEDVTDIIIKIPVGSQGKKTKDEIILDLIEILSTSVENLSEKQKVLAERLKNRLLAASR